MSEKKLVPEGAFLVCDKGTLPSQITSSSMEEVSIYGETVITEADKVFMVNFQPLGLCVCLHGQPCMAQPLMWDSLADGITVGQFAPTLEDAKLPCALGGQISIFPTPAVAFAKVPKSAKQEKDFWDKTLDFGLGVGEGLWTGAKGTVIGVCDLAVWTAKHMPPYVLLNPSGYAEQLQKDAATVKALGGLAADAGTWVYRNSTVNMLANPEDYAAAQQESKQAMGALAEKMNNMDARDWGNFTGQVGFEIGLNMATGGGAGIATGMKAADLTGDAMRAAQKLDKALEATRAVDKASDATRAVDKLEDVADADKAVDKAEDASDAAKAADKAEDVENVADAAGPEKLGDVVYGGDKVPANKMKGKKPDAPGYNVKDEHGELTEYGKWYYERPGWRDKTINDTWDNAKDLEGKVYDRLSQKEIIWDKTKNRGDQWHMGHKEGYEFSKHQQSAADRRIGVEQFRDEYNHADHIEPELPSSNISHQGEAPKNIYYGF